MIKKQEPSFNIKQATNQIQVQNQQQNSNQHGSILVAQLSNKNVSEVRIHAQVCLVDFDFIL